MIRFPAPSRGSRVSRKAAEYGATGPDTARLLVSCPDRRGIVAAISTFFFERGANIVTADQYSSDPEGGTFFLRITFHLADMAAGRERLLNEFAEVAKRFSMSWRFSFGWDRRRIGLMVSREDHCVMDLIWRWQRNELDADVGVVVSNHSVLADSVRRFGLPYFHVPVDASNRASAETEALKHLAGCDLVVLARYMQILSGDFLDGVGCPVINIHHSFLPAFPGAEPYRRARDRGVKLIGATAHYVTAELDAGPIIEQDVLRVNHRYTPTDLARVGRDVERVVLARAVRSHLDDRVLVDGARSIVF